MERAIIIYGSQYGSTKRYAERLSEMTGIEAVAFKEAKDIDKYDRVIFMGALYAGSVLGLKKTAYDYSHLSLKHRMMMAVVHSRISKMPEDKLNAWSSESRQTCLDGRVVTGKDKVNAEAKTILVTYGKKVDYVDFQTLDNLRLCP